MYNPRKFKAIALTLVLALTLAFVPASPSAAVVSSSPTEPFGTPTGTFLTNPATGLTLPVTDVQAELAAIAAEDPLCEEKRAEEEERFLENRASQEESTLVPKSSLRGIAALSAVVPSPIPTSSGVAYGYWFNQTFDNDFEYGATIAYDILCPQKAGGNNAYTIYLTSTNRAELACEAYVSYYAQSDMEFCVWDWSKDSSYLAPPISYSTLVSQGYLRTKTVNGQSFSYVTVMNSTSYQTGGLWKNEVFLENSTGYHSVYSRTYASTTRIQKYGYDDEQMYAYNWGPIIETFQTSYSGTNAMGFGPTYIGSRMTSATAWTPWALLNTSQSFVNGPDRGFYTTYTIPNHTFIAKS